MNLSRLFRASFAAAILVGTMGNGVAAPAATSDSAPADRYFGRMKLSFLGINNTFTDARKQVVAYTNDAGVMNKLGFADESLTLWAAEFPRDPELARSYFLATEVYKKIWVKSYQDKAWTYMHLIIEKFPNSYFGKQVKKELEIGYTEHYFLDPVPCPTPMPTATPTPEATASPQGGKHPKPTPSTAPSPEPTSSPVPTASPTPLPTQVPGGPKLDIRELPCIPATTPAPSPSP